MMQRSEGFARADEALTEIVTIRRLASHRALLTRGTGLEGRTTIMRILRAVDDLSREGTPSIREVAERLGMEHSNTSRAVDQAMEADLLAKHPSKTDGRRLELSLTDRGHHTIHDLNDRRDEVQGELMIGWDEHEAATLAVLLEKLVDSYLRLLGRSS